MNYSNAGENKISANNLATSLLIESELAYSHSLNTNFETARVDLKYDDNTVNANWTEGQITGGQLL